MIAANAEIGCDEANETAPEETSDDNQYYGHGELDDRERREERATARGGASAERVDLHRAGGALEGERRN
ncbi:MAG TPA: hypothetical protein VFI22_17705 [Thermomicrobiales bacterium]|nr:hypothetical protein [Thermomicrobiales bacterium]